MLDSHFVVCTTAAYSPKEYKKKFGHEFEIDRNLIHKQFNEFFKNKNPRVLTLDEVKNRKIAYFELGHHGMKDMVILSHIMVDYQIEDDKLVAYKLWEHWSGSTIELYKFPLENYGVTWRCWSAVPTVKQIRQEKWQ